MSEKTIPLDAVRNALMCAALKQKVAGREAAGRPIGRVAAYSYYSPIASATCRTAHRGRSQGHFPGQHFGVMTHGDLNRVLERAHQLGLREVRATWLAGVRALKAEFAQVLR